MNMGLARVLSDTEVLGLIHVVWRRWRELRSYVYRSIGVRNTEELIAWVMDVDRCRPIGERLDRFLEVLRGAAERLGLMDSAVAEVKRVLAMGVEVIPFFFERYPCELLRYRTGTDFIYPPLVLYAMRLHIDVNSRPAVAIVGTRRCSAWGRTAAFELGKRIAERNLLLVTGLAEGIDVSAALGAIEGGGYVIGVRPWLAPLTLPHESRRVVEESSGRVAVVSENLFKPGSSSRRAINYLYYLRNRIIAGMSRVVIVVEARDHPHSGSMHQIELALKRGKPVVVLEHPEQGSTYWRAFEKYVSKGARVARDLDEAVKVVEELTS